MNLHFYIPKILLLLWIIPVVVGLFLYAGRRRKQALLAFGAKGTLTRHVREAVGICAAVALIIVGLARPAWDQQRQAVLESSRDVIFVLDVSRSMLATDLFPNRLENAKTAVLDCIEGLSGDRVGLVLFAGSAEIRCPLTVDYDYFRMALRQASPDNVTVGGTVLANALDKVVNKLLDPEKAGYQDLILITDGEDLIKGSDEVDAARRLGQAGARLIAIGIGNRSHGKRIPLEEHTYLKHGNTEVWTKLHSETLRRMASATTDGIYFEVADGPFDLKEIYRQIMEHAQRSPVEKQLKESYKEKFYLFLAGAIIILLFTNRRRKK